MGVFKKLQDTATPNTAMSGLKYIHFPYDYMEVVVYIDASITVNPDRSSQLGILATLCIGMDGTVNIFLLTLTKSKLVCSSALTVELFALVDGYDIGHKIAYTLEEPYGRKVTLPIYTDSHSLYGLCIPVGT